MMKDTVEGLIQLVFTPRKERTIASRIYHEGNSRVSAAVSLANEATPYYFLINTGGGFTEGETYEVDILLDQNAQAIVTTQAPTYVYKCETGRVTNQKITIKLEPGSSLEYLSDEVIPYKHSAYKQETIVQMAENATLILLDGVTAGWSEDERLFQYTQLQMKTTIFMENQLIYNDYLLCEPTKNNLDSLGHFEGKSNYNSLVVVSPFCTEHVIERIREHLSTIKTTVDFGISSLEKPGFVLRALGESRERNRAILMSAFNYFRTQILEGPELASTNHEQYFND